jgi:uncharacterized protein YndB with AHSA1/START domain
MTDAAPTFALTLERTLAASPERVFRAWTDPAELTHWFAPNPELAVEAELDLRVGGAYRIRMGRHEAFGAYVAIDPPHTLAFTWRWASEPDADATVVTVSLAPLGDGTLLTLRHERFESAEERANHDLGWTQSLARLVAHAASFVDAGA